MSMTTPDPTRCPPDATSPGRFTQADIECLTDRRLTDGKFPMHAVTLRHRRFDGDWTPEIERVVMHRPEAAGVLLYDPRHDAVVLIEQFRIGAIGSDRPWKLELVAGIIEEGQTPEEAARREALEEANAVIDTLVPIHHYFPSPGGCSERIHLFCGLVDVSGLGGVHGLASEHEDIRVHVVSRETAMAWMDSGRLDSAMAMIALYWLAAHPQGEKLR